MCRVALRVLAISFAASAAASGCDLEGSRLVSCLRMDTIEDQCVTPDSRTRARLARFCAGAVACGSDGIEYPSVCEMHRLAEEGTCQVQIPGTLACDEVPECSEGITGTLLALESEGD